MEFNNQEELMQAAADVYGVAETIYKGSEINADTLYSTAKNHFDFTDAQLNQLSDYFQKEEQEFWGLEDDSLEETKLEENESNKITYKELKEIFTNINRNKEPVKYGVIVFTEDSFNKPYSLESRSYKVSSDNKVFRPDAIGYSLYGSALDGSDDGVRLESYMKEEHGGSNGWKVDYCYILDDEKEVE